MGEAWSDWYAMDYLADTLSCAPVACFVDRRASRRPDRRLRLARQGRSRPRSGSRRSTARSAPPTARPAPRRTPASRPAAYTYGSLGKIDGAPEVHSDGEIWAQTLWDLRSAVGRGPHRAPLVTRAMELSPDDPSFLDMRNAILQADTVASTAAPPRPDLGGLRAPRHGLLRRRRSTAPTRARRELRDAAGREHAQGRRLRVRHRPRHPRPGAGARVSFAGLDSGFPGNAGATVDRTGEYTMPDLPIGTYPYLVAGGAGYEPLVVRRVPLAAGSHRRDLKPRRA